MITIDPEKVTAILPTEIDLTIFVDTAELVINESLADSGLTTERLELIGAYLAAHFACLQEKQAASERIGEASTTYQGSTGKGYTATQYGQTALMLDSTGTLERSSAATAESKGKSAILGIY